MRCDAKILRELCLDSCLKVGQPVLGGEVDAGPGVSGKVRTEVIASRLNNWVEQTVKNGRAGNLG